MIIAKPFSVLFWVCYFGCGISDILDGGLARLLKQESEFGAKLDSISDIIFAVAIFIVVVANIRIYLWMWLSVMVIVILRVIGYGIGFNKYHTFSSLHTYLNKAAGALIFLSPIIYMIVGGTVTMIGLCVIAFISAVEELVITVKSKELDRDCRGIFYINNRQ